MNAADPIAGFVRRLGRRRRLWGALVALAGHVPLVATLWLGAEVAGWGPAGDPRVIGGALVWLGLAAAHGWSRSRVNAGMADAGLGFRDALRTWLGLRRDASPMVQWLNEDLGERIARLPVERVREIERPRLGVLRYALPVLIALLLIRAFAPQLPPRLPSVSGPSIAGGGGGGEGGGSGSGGGSGGSDAPREQEESSADPEPEPGPPPEPQRPPDADPAPSPDAPESGSATAEPPRPLLEREVEDLFVVPEFIGDGPSRRELVPQAVLPQAPAPADTPPAGGTAADAPPPPDFERQLENALRARHVPPHERPFVRRYFESLVEAARQPR